MQVTHLVSCVLSIRLSQEGGGSGVMANLGTHLVTRVLVKVLDSCTMSLCSLQEITPFMNALTQILLAHRQQQSGSTLATLLTDTSPDTESASQ